MEQKKIGRPQKPNKEKVTLSIDRDILQKTKAHAEKKNKTTSSVIEDALTEYLDTILSFSDRIQTVLDDGTPSRVPYIKLHENEYPAYSGSGLALVSEEKGQVKEIFYLFSETDSIADEIKTGENIVQKMKKWQKENAKYNQWLCMASCHELCDPLQLNSPQNIREALARITEEILSIKYNQ